MEISNELGYLCRIVDNSKIPTGLTNSGFSSFASGVLGIPEKTLMETLRNAGIIVDGEPGAPFRPLGVYNFNPEPSSRERMVSGILQVIMEDNLARNFLILLMARYRFSIALMETIIETHGDMLRITSANCAYAVMTSDYFLQEEDVNNWAIEQEAALRTFNSRSIGHLLETDWFLSLIKVLRDEDSGSFHGSIDTILAHLDGASMKELLSSISGGILPALATQNRLLYMDERIRLAFHERNRRQNEVRRLRRFYYWLGVANDLSLGLEFVTGSVEFFPRNIFAGANNVLGVYLFIVGSSQLVGRSLIQIAMQMHERHRKKKSSRRISDTLDT
ncbi:MAG: YrhK family protein [Thermoplasmataceae archaeon]